MRLACAVIITAASLTAIVKHDHATQSPVALSAVSPEPTPPARASRSEIRRPLRAARGPLAHRRRAPVRRPAARSGALNWHALAECESSNDPSTNTGNGFYGLYQFDLTTWRSVGGTGLPSDASRQEQTYRASLLYARRGREPWPICGRWL